MSVADFTMLLRVPGQPVVVRVYTDDERDEAVRYAGKSGGVAVSSTHPPPTGYMPGRDGSLVPAVACCR